MENISVNYAGKENIQYVWVPHPLARAHTHAHDDETAVAKKWSSCDAIVVYIADRCHIRNETKKSIGNFNPFLCDTTKK